MVEVAPSSDVCCGFDAEVSPVSNPLRRDMIGIQARTESRGAGAARRDEGRSKSCRSKNRGCYPRKQRMLSRNQMCVEAYRHAILTSQNTIPTISRHWSNTALQLKGSDALPHHPVEPCET